MNTSTRTSLKLFLERNVVFASCLTHISDINSEVCETVLQSESAACELPHTCNEHAICHGYSNVNAMDFDQSDVIILDKNEDLKPEINRIVIDNKNEFSEMLSDDTRFADICILKRHIYIAI